MLDSIRDPFPSQNVLTYAQAAGLVGCDWRTVKKAVQDGQLAAIVIGQRVMVAKQPLLRMLNEGQSIDWPEEVIR